MPTMLPTNHVSKEDNPPGQKSTNNKSTVWHYYVTLTQAKLDYFIAVVKHHRIIDRTPCVQQVIFRCLEVVKVVAVADYGKQTRTQA